MNNNSSLTDQSIREQLTATVNQIRSDSGRPTRDLSDSDRLAEDLELDSLDLAVLVVKSEQQWGVDPFRQRTSGVSTLGDLVRLYQQAIAGRRGSSEVET